MPSLERWRAGGSLIILVEGLVAGGSGGSGFFLYGMAKRKKTTTTWGRVFGNVFYILFLGLFLFSGSVAGWLSQSAVMREGFIDMVRQTPPQQVFGAEGAPVGSLTVLLLGTDQERDNRRNVTNASARSDLMMVVRMDFDRRIIGAVSIPRDTLCELPGYRRQKINAYHAIGGPNLSRRAVEYLLPGVFVDRVVVLNFDAFKEVVDLLGGVEVYVPKDMRYTDNWGGLNIDLRKGRQVLNGEDAMGFVRFRKGKNGASDSDFERQKRQKDFLLALKDRMVSRWQLGPTVLDKSVKLADDAFTAREVASLLSFAQKVETENVRMGQIPVVDVPGTYDLAVRTSELEETLRMFHVLGGTPMARSR